MCEVDVDAVTALVREVGETVVLPRQAMLASGDVEEKSPGELVTAVDRDAELLLTEALLALLPGSVVVGEEACAADPSVMARLTADRPVWLVDPLDGTSNYVNGSPDFAVMVALLQRGDTVSAWISRPATQTCYVAERGAGAYAGDARLTRQPAPGDLGSLTGAALTRFLDDRHRGAVARLGSLVRRLGPGRVCAGVEYPLVAEAGQDFVFFWRTLPWDHAAGALLVTEAGGCVAHLDGAAYAPIDGRPGLLVAADPMTHQQVRDVLRSDDTIGG